jgi:hypothetical protein
MSERKRLDNRRASETFTLEVLGLTYMATFSCFPDGRVAEIFLSNHKSGSAADTAARDSAVVASLALQHGVPLETLRKSLLRDSHGNASGPLGCALDYISERES